jgi:hypothetical protein
MGRGAGNGKGPGGRRMIQFDPATHTYTVEGVKFPSVTQILQAMGFVDTAFFTEHARTRGKYVHQIIGWSVTGEIDESTIDPELQGYLDAWGAFIRDTGFISTATEKPMGSILHRFAGTPDHIGMLNKQEAVVDAKTGAIAPWVGLQLAGYEILAARPLKRFALALKEDGKYSLKAFTDRQDSQIFKAALAVYWWQKNNLRNRT